MKRKISKLNQIDGKADSFAPTTLDQVWGDDGMSKYKTMDLAVYKDSLNQMNLTDLQNHAVKIGLIPSDRRDVLTNKLVKEFQLFVGSHRLPKQAPKAPKMPSAKVIKILSEGR